MRDFCGFCGTKFIETEYPRTCVGCGRQTFLNPTPVVVVLQPVETKQGDIGAIMGKRAIEPQKGQWSLISGFMNVGESAEDAAKREFNEETSLHLAGEPRYVGSTFNEYHMLMMLFVVDQPMPYETYLLGKPCPENEQLGIAWKHKELAFPIQSELLKKWFNGESNVE